MVCIGLFPVTDLQWNVRTSENMMLPLQGTDKDDAERGVHHIRQALSQDEQAPRKLGY